MLFSDDSHTGHRYFKVLLSSPLSQFKQPHHCHTGVRHGTEAFQGVDPDIQHLHGWHELAHDIIHVGNALGRHIDDIVVLEYEIFGEVSLFEQGEQIDLAYDPCPPLRRG